MESSEFSDLSESLYKSLERLSCDVEKAHNENADYFSCPVKNLDKEEGAASLELTSKQLAHKLEEQMLESSSNIKEGFPESDLHIYLSLLADMDQESENQVVLIKQYKQQIQDLKKNTTEIEENTKLIEEIITDRELIGEMAELRGYTNVDIIKMEKETFKIFSTHRERLRQLLPKLYPDCHVEMHEILAKLADNEFGDSESSYVKLKDDQWLKVGQILLRLGVVSHYPKYTNWIKLAILD